MIELKNSGLPVYLNQENNVLAISALLPFNGYGRKLAGEMRGLFADELNLDDSEVIYDVYRGLAFPKDEKLLNEYSYRYDFTVILPGSVNGELKKTSGHYHGYNQTRTNTYAEVYEVVKGSALYVLQRVVNFDTEPTNVKIDDVILVKVDEGQTLIVPPNYGHCSINIGAGPLVFSNLAYVPCPVLYDSVKHYRGMSYYVKRENEELEIVKNHNYKTVPAAKNAIVKQNPKLGIEFGLPIYHSFMENPEAFEYLRNPDYNLSEVMDMLIIE